LFADVDSPISLAFLARFDCQDRADWLSPKRLAAWLNAARYSGRKDPAELYTRLASAPHGATGDCRARFRDPASLAALAEVAPSTRQSGKIKVVSFRWAADKQLRDAACDFAGDSRHASPCAARLYNDAIARGKDHPHAVRILARAWLYIISHCWQDGAAYDPALHKALQRILAEQNRRLDTGLLTL